VCPQSDGRAFGSGDGRGGAARIAIVSNAFWREFLGGAASAIGTDIALDGARYRVAGVMPSTFRFPSGLEQIWTPYDIEQPPAEATPSRGLTAVARLANGVTRDDADRRVRVRGESLNLASGGRKGTTAALMNAAGGVDEASEKSLQVLIGAVCFLFLIVCANVANITLSRSAARAHDLATCAALGASPGDLWRQVLLEQAMVACAGVAGGAVLAWAGVSVAAAVLPESMTSATLNAIDLDSRTLLFLMTGGVIAALGSGLAPALVARRTSVVSLLNTGARSSASSLANRFRTALAAAEVAVSVLLLVGSALMTRTFLNRALEDPGFDPVNLVSLRVGFPARYGDAASRDRAAVDLSARLQGIGSAKSTVGGLPSDVDLMSFGQFEFEGRDGLTEPTPVPVHEVPADYFAVTGIRLLRGRTFAVADTNPVVVNDRFANKFFPAAMPSAGDSESVPARGERSSVLRQTPLRPRAMASGGSRPSIPSAASQMPSARPGRRRLLSTSGHFLFAHRRAARPFRRSSVWCRPLIRRWSSGNRRWSRMCWPEHSPGPARSSS
jgi:putative ABC transport system permease protein